MILIIDNYDSFTYNLYQLIAENLQNQNINQDIKVIRNDKINISEIKDLNPKAIILSPGPGRPEDAGICIDIIKNFHKDTPILGICLGHQAIAHYFGGKISKAPTVRHGQSVNITHENKGLFKNCPKDNMSIGLYHSLCADIYHTPDILEIHAKCKSDDNKHDIIMALKHKKYDTYGLQFHPESILTKDGDILINEFIKKAKIKNKNKNKNKNNLNYLFNKASKQEIKDTLIKLNPNNITKDDFLEFLLYAQKNMVSIKPNKPTLDIVGTGGDGKHTVNISTAASLLTASLGIPTAKHGGRSNSSKSGSADLMEAFGYDINQTPADACKQINKTNFGFCFAPNYHPIFKNVAPARAEIKSQTIFNLMGPMLNPANAEYRIIGVANPDLLDLFAETLQIYGEKFLKKGIIVHAAGCDELNTMGPADIREVTPNKITKKILDPKQYGFKAAKLSDLQADSENNILNNNPKNNNPKNNLKKILSVFNGEQSPLADTIILNAAMGISIYKNIDLKEAIKMCQDHLKNKDFKYAK